MLMTENNTEKDNIHFSGPDSTNLSKPFSIPCIQLTDQHQIKYFRDVGLEYDNCQENLQSDFLLLSLFFLSFFPNSKDLQSDTKKTELE